MAVSIINILSSSVLKERTPYEVLFHKVPDYSRLRLFGCSCFPLTKPYNGHKFDYKSAECVFLGPSLTHKGYKCWSSSGRNFIARDVIFNETAFPYSTLFPNTTVTISSSNHQTSALPPVLYTAPFNISQPPSPSLNTLPSPLPHDPLPSPSPHIPQSPSSASSLFSHPPPSNPTCSVHPMITRSKTDHLKPKAFIASEDIEPTDPLVALQSPNWRKAMERRVYCFNKKWHVVISSSTRKSTSYRLQVGVQEES